MPGDKGPHHTEAWHRCWDKLQNEGKTSESAAAICTSSTERTGNVYENHSQPSGHETRQHHKAVEMIQHMLDLKKVDRANPGGSPASSAGGEFKAK